MKHLIALALTVAAMPATAASLEAIHRALKPWDIVLPPTALQAKTDGPINVIFSVDPRKECRQAEGMITLACTLERTTPVWNGKTWVDGPKSKLTVMPMPTNFRDESFAYMIEQAVMTGDIGAEIALWRTSCAPKYRGQVYARLGCHETIGHQLNGWKH